MTEEEKAEMRFVASGKGLTIIKPKKKVVKKAKTAKAASKKKQSK